MTIGTQLPLEVLFKIYKHVVDAFFEQPRLAILDTSQEPGQHGGGLHIACTNKLALHMETAIISLTLCNVTSRREALRLLKSHTEDSDLVLQKFSLVNLGLRVKHDVFVLRGIPHVLAQPMPYFPGIDGVEVEDFRPLQNLMLLASEFLSCFEPAMPSDEPEDISLRLLELFRDRDWTTAQCFIIIGAEAIPDDLSFDRIEVLRGDETVEGGFLLVDDLGQVRQVRRRWREWDAQGEVGLPRLQLVRIHQSRL